MGDSVHGGLYQGDPPYGKERAVRIVLECILVTPWIQLGEYWALRQMSFLWDTHRTSISMVLGHCSDHRNKMSMWHFVHLSSRLSSFVPACICRKIPPPRIRKAGSIHPTGMLSCPKYLGEFLAVLLATFTTGLLFPRWLRQGKQPYVLTETAHYPKYLD